MKLYELKPGDEFTFLNLKTAFGRSKFQDSVIGKRFRLDKYNSAIQRCFVTGLDPEVEKFQAELCYHSYEVILLSAAAPKSVLPTAPPQPTLPHDLNYLGDIEFLRDHPDILRKLIAYSKDGILAPFIRSRCSNDWAGGMRWVDTPEGEVFWTAVLQNRNPKKFYELYPRKETPSASMSSKPTYNGTQQKVPRPTPAIRTGKRADGRAVRGKTSRTAIICGHLSHRAVSGS